MGAMDPYIFVSFELKIFFCKAHTGVTLANVRTHVTRRKREITNKSQQTRTLKTKRLESPGTHLIHLRAKEKTAFFGAHDLQKMIFLVSRTNSWPSKLRIIFYFFFYIISNDRLVGVNRCWHQADEI